MEKKVIKKRNVVTLKDEELVKIVGGKAHAGIFRGKYIGQVKETIGTWLGRWFK